MFMFEAMDSLLHCYKFNQKKNPKQNPESWEWLEKFPRIKTFSTDYCSRKGQAEQHASERIQALRAPDEVPGELLRQTVQVWAGRDPEFRGHLLLPAKRTGPAVGLHQQQVRVEKWSSENSDFRQRSGSGFSSGFRSEKLDHRLSFTFQIKTF